MGDQVLQGGKCDPRRDVEATIVQGADFVMLDGIPRLGIVVFYRQRVAACKIEVEHIMGKSEVNMKRIAALG